MPLAYSELKKRFKQKILWLDEKKASQLTELSDHTGLNESDVLRRAIELYYSQLISEN